MREIKSKLENTFNEIDINKTDAFGNDGLWYAKKTGDNNETKNEDDETKNDDDETKNDDDETKKLFIGGMNFKKSLQDITNEFIENEYKMLGEINKSNVNYLEQYNEDYEIFYDVNKNINRIIYLNYYLYRSENKNLTNQSIKWDNLKDIFELNDKDLINFVNFFTLIDEFIKSIGDDEENNVNKDIVKNFCEMRGSTEYDEKLEIWKNIKKCFNINNTIFMPEESFKFIKKKDIDDMSDVIKEKNEENLFDEQLNLFHKYGNTKYITDELNYNKPYIIPGKTEIGNEITVKNNRYISKIGGVILGESHKVHNLRHNINNYDDDDRLNKINRLLGTDTQFIDDKFKYNSLYVVDKLEQSVQTRTINDPKNKFHMDDSGNFIIGSNGPFQNKRIPLKYKLVNKDENNGNLTFSTDNNNFDCVLKDREGNPIKGVWGVSLYKDFNINIGDIDNIDLAQELYDENNRLNVLKMINETIDYLLILNNQDGNLFNLHHQNNILLNGINDINNIRNIVNVDLEDFYNEYQNLIGTNNEIKGNLKGLIEIQIQLIEIFYTIIQDNLSDQVIDNNNKRINTLIKGFIDNDKKTYYITKKYIIAEWEWDKNKCGLQQPNYNADIVILDDNDNDFINKIEGIDYEVVEGTNVLLDKQSNTSERKSASKILEPIILNNDSLDELVSKTIPKEFYNSGEHSLSLNSSFKILDIYIYLLNYIKFINIKSVDIELLYKIDIYLYFLYINKQKFLKNIFLNIDTDSEDSDGIISKLTKEIELLNKSREMEKILLKREINDIKDIINKNGEYETINDLGNKINILIKNQLKLVEKRAEKIDILKSTEFILKYNFIKSESGDNDNNPYIDSVYKKNKNDRFDTILHTIRQLSNELIFNSIEDNNNLEPFINYVQPIINGELKFLSDDNKTYTLKNKQLLDSHLNIIKYKIILTVLNMIHYKINNNNNNIKKLWLSNPEYPNYDYLMRAYFRENYNYDNIYYEDLIISIDNLDSLKKIETKIKKNSNEYYFYHIIANLSNTILMLIIDSTLQENLRKKIIIDSTKNSNVDLPIIPIDTGFKVKFYKEYENIGEIAKTPLLKGYKKKTEDDGYYPIFNLKDDDIKLDKCKKINIKILNELNKKINFNDHKIKNSEGNNVLFNLIDNMNFNLLEESINKYKISVYNKNSYNNNNISPLEHSVNKCIHDILFVRFKERNDEENNEENDESKYSHRIKLFYNFYNREYKEKILNNDDYGYNILNHYKDILNNVLIKYINTINQKYFDNEDLIINTLELIQKRISEKKNYLLIII